MPEFTTDLSLPDKDDVIVRPVLQYATLWSQFLTDTPGSTVLYYALGPLFFMRLVIVSFYAPSLILTTNTNLYPVQIPSTAKDYSETPIAYTADEKYSLIKASRLRRLIQVPKLVYIALQLYIHKQSIAYIAVNHNAEKQQLESDDYFVTEDNDSLRPLILLKD